MPVYKKQSVGALPSIQKPQVAPLTGLKLAKASRVAAVMRAQDKVAPQSRRLVACQALNGVARWLTPGTNPDNATQTHPIADELREVARARIDVTPGCFFYLFAVHIPSGETQIEVNPGTDYDQGGPSGEIQCTINWTDQDGNVTITVHNQPLVSSALLYGAATASPWYNVRIVGIGPMTPPDVGDTDDLAIWSRHVHAEIILMHIGGCRIVDLTVEEWPHSLAREVDDAGDLWTSHFFAGPHPDGDAPTLTHPMQRISETSPDGDPRYGSWHIMDVNEAQRLRLGPSLFQWTPYNEADADVSSTVITTASTTSATFVRVADGVAGYDNTGPGWSLSNFARDYAENHPFWSTNSGSIPVMVAVYGATTDIAATGAVRVQSSVSSWVDVDITDRTFAWWFGYGHLRCGVGPGDDSVAQALYRMVSGTGSIRVRSIVCYRMGNYPAAFA